MMISLRPFHGVLAALLAFSTVPTAAQEVPAELLKPVEEAIAADDFQKAERLLIQVSRATRGNRGMQAEVAAIRREIGALERSFQELEQERSVLKTSPQDPAASQVIGEYYAFMKGDWERGLALLAQGDNEATKAAATFDLTQPTDFQSQLNAGDLWRQVAETAREKSVISRATLRARFWYLRASELAGSESELGMIAECLDELAFYPSKIVIFNSHNGQYNGRGVLVADIKLSLDGQVVYKRRHPLAWQKGVSVPTIIHIPRNRADAVQVDVLKFYRNGAGHWPRSKSTRMA